MNREAAGWSAPQNIENLLNSVGQDAFPTVAANGNLYFWSDRPPDEAGATDRDAAGDPGHVHLFKLVEPQLVEPPRRAKMFIKLF